MKADVNPSFNTLNNSSHEKQKIIFNELLAEVKPL